MASLKHSMSFRRSTAAMALVAMTLVGSVASAGPMDSLPAGRWHQFANSRMDSVAPNPAAEGALSAVMFAWSGGVFDTDRDQLVVWGGGHTDYSGNEVYAFGPINGTNPQWKRLTNPSNPPARNQPRGADGRPVSRHTYNLLVYMPAPYNKMMSCAIGSEWESGSGYGGVDFYDFTIDGMTGQPWTAGPTAPSNRWPLNAFCAYNPVTQRAWYQDMGNGAAQLQQYNPATNTWTAHATFNPDSWPTPAIDTKRNILVATGELNGTIIYDLNSPDSAPFHVTTTGPKNIENGKFPGFAYDPVNDQFIGWNGGTAVYALSIPSNLRSGTWEWTQIPLDPANTVTPTQIAGPKIVGYVTGTYGRFRYVPSAHGVVIVNAIDESVYFFKLPNNGGTPLPQVSLTANPTSVPAQGTTTLTWSTTNAASCTASGAWTGARATSGSEAVGPLNSNSTFTLACDNGSGGTGNRSVTVQIAQATPAPTVTFSANPTSVATNGTSLLTWTTANAASCTASGAWSGSKPTQGSQSVGPLTQQVTYTLTCTGSGGTTAQSAMVTVVAAPPAPAVNLTATPSAVNSGSNSTLQWTATNATTCTASGGWSGAKATSGNQSVGPITANTTYTLSCTGAGGTAQRSAAVTVNAAPTPAPVPTVSLSASPASVSVNGSSTLTWSSTDATSCTASGDWSGTKATSGSESTGALSNTTNYTLSCSGAGGSAQQSATVTVTAGGGSGGSPTPDSSGGGGSFGLLSLLAMLYAHLRRRALRVVRLSRLLALTALLFGAGGISTAMAADITTVVAVSQSSSAQSSIPVTFGQVFKPGDIPSGSSVRARLSSGADLPLQVDRKATNPDGSLRHAVLTATIPSLGANTSQTITLNSGAASTGTAVALSSLLATGFDALVTLNVGGTVYTASARTALANSPVTWLSGPQVSEWLASMPVRTSGGTAHPHLTAYFHVRAYAGAPITQARVDVVIENNWTMVAGAGNKTYDATVSVPGKSDYVKAGLTHYGHTRWHKRFWWGTQPAVYVKLDKDYLQDSKAIPKYENVQPTDAFLNSVRRSTEPMDNGDQTTNMEDPGFQEAIGPLPKWDAVYAVSTDPRAFDYMLANADGGAAYSSHFRDENTGYPVSIDNYPNATLADPQASSPVIPEGGSSPFNVVWSAHQPSIGFLPYLVTGDYFYLEEAQFWSAYNLIWPSASGRGGNKGWWYTQSLRGQAWAYRSLSQVAYATPDTHALKGYFLSKLSSNLQRDIALYVSPGGPHKNNLGAMYMAEGNEQYRFYDYFMSWVVQYVVDLGFTEAIPFRDYKVKFPIGLMGASATEYCFQSAAQYTWRVGPAGTSTFYPDFRTVYQNTAGSVSGTACGTSAMASALGLSLNEMVGGQTETGYYFANLQPALASAYDSGVAGGVQAWNRAQLSGKHPDYRNEPIWAVIPRGASQPSVTVSLSANPTTVQTGGSTTLTWSSSNADSCSASGAWAGNKATSGTESISSLQANSSFTLSCTSNTLGSSSSTALVTVTSSTPAPTVSLAASPTSVATGASTTLTWSSTNATSCTASGGWSGTQATSGTQSSGALNANATFTLSCSGAGGSAQRSVNVTVTAPAPAAPTVSLAANPTSVSSGGSSQLQWSSTNATTCTASGGWSGSKQPSGSQTIASLAASTTFTLSCTGSGGSAQQSATVTVTGTPPAPTPATVTLSASPTAVNVNGTSTLTWSSTNATACTASDGWSGAKATSGTETTAALANTATFTLSCSGAGGASALQSVTVTVNAGGGTSGGSSSSEGGGGSFGLLSLIALLAARRLRRAQPAA